MTTVPRRPPTARTRTGSSRLDVLHLLEAEGSATVGTVAARTGLHENTVRAHLERLVATGLAVREPEVRTVRGRPRLVYRPAGDGTASSDPDRARRLDEATARAALTRLLLDGYGAPAADVTSAARAAGERMLGTLPGPPAAAPDPTERDQLSALAEHLDRLGFDPVPGEPAPGTRTVGLWRCPFLDLARARPEVVCAVHLGLAQGVLDRVGGPLRADRLVPFAGPRHCELHLATAS
ncbi:helix-turn-helix transcriptional regulator [Cellulomonas endometrii]|uniref:helix-turn-helix transcriptional regulator n=1 Tax=Cellulomonas endometrii TaxID=3036301 RepID=UPI0024AD9194|nr:helix-turn-helix domain-containing protein [Cellulomonas endometrii]